MKRKVTAFVLLLVLLTSLLTGCGKGKEATAGNTGEQKGKREIRIGYQIANTAILLAKAKGWYEEEFGKDGTEVKYQLFLSGPPLIEAFAGDRIDIGSTGDMPPVSARASGIDIKVIARAGGARAGSALLVRPDSPIRSVADLKGKKVAVQVGSAAHQFLALLLQQNGLKLNDINLVNLPAPDQQNALGTKNVDAISTWEPWVASVEYAKVGKVLIDSRNVKRSLAVFLARNEFATQNPDLVERFLKVYLKAVDYIKKNPDEVLQLVSKESKLPVPVLEKSFKDTDWDPNIYGEDVKALEQVKDFLKETNVIKKDFNINDLIDRTYLKKVGVQ